MSSLPHSFQNRLRDAFAQNNLEIDFQGDACKVKIKPGLEPEKIEEIVTTLGYHCSAHPKKMGEQYSFTIQEFSELMLQYENINVELLKLGSGLPESYQAHYQRNRQNILSHAENLTGQAIVLGYGNGRDIPLEELARQFNRVTIVDIDRHAMMQSLQKLPAALRSKVIPIEKDLTGMVEIIKSSLEKLPADLSAKQYLDRLTDILSNAVDNTPPLLENDHFDFVVSSMLTTQLHSAIDLMIKDRLSMIAPAVLDNNEFQEDYGDLYYKFTEVLCDKHLLNLEALSKPEARIYYADTAVAESTELNEDGTLEKIDQQETLPNDFIERKIDRYFRQTKDAEDWEWETIHPTEENQEGSMMRVIAYYLEK